MFIFYQLLVITKRLRVPLANLEKFLLLLMSSFEFVSYRFFNQEKCAFLVIPKELYFFPLLCVVNSTKIAIHLSKIYCSHLALELKWIRVVCIILKVIVLGCLHISEDINACGSDFNGCLHHHNG